MHSFYNFVELFVLGARILATKVSVTYFEIGSKQKRGESYHNINFLIKLYVGKIWHSAIRIKKQNYYCIFIISSGLYGS